MQIKKKGEDFLYGIRDGVIRQGLQIHDYKQKSDNVHLILCTSFWKNSIIYTRGYTSNERAERE